MSGFGNDKKEQFSPRKPGGVSYTRHNHTQTRAFLIRAFTVRQLFQSISWKVILVAGLAVSTICQESETLTSRSGGRIPG